MEFGWINLAGGIIIVLMLVPNIAYALRRTGESDRCENKWMNLQEQVGRYACMALMILPLGMGEFGFPSVAAMFGYLLGNGTLLVLYWINWAVYFRTPSRDRALTLAVAPTMIFLLSGLMLRHWLLVIAGGLFGIAHVFVTLENHK